VINSKTGSETTKARYCKMSSFIYSFITSTHFELKENFMSVKELSKNKIINIKEIMR
jgi:hypothetical protein